MKDTNHDIFVGEKCWCTTSVLCSSLNSGKTLSKFIRFTVYVQYICTGWPVFPRTTYTKTTAVSLLALFDGLKANKIVVQGYCG